MTPNGILDSGASSTFLQKGVGIPTGHPSTKIVGMPNGHTERASLQVLLPNEKLSYGARKADELPSLRHNSLVSVPTLANNGYTTVFKPGQEGVEVYESKEVKIVASARPVLRGWRDSSGLWRVPLSSNSSPSPDNIDSGQIDIL